MFTLWRRAWPALVIVLVVLSGCTVNRDIMFKTPIDQEFGAMPDSTDPIFRIQTNDYLQFRLFANDGFKMIDLVSSGQDAQRALGRITFSYLVEYDGTVKLPLVGRVHMAGKNLREAELYLEGLYVTYYNRPYVQLVITNRRVVVFPGGGGDAKVIPLDNNNTTLLEVIADAGGLARRGRAARVKLFRRNSEGKRDVFMFDLSDIDGLKYADVVMEGDDIVYVEPNPELARELLYDLTPVISLLTTVILVIGIARGFN